MKRKRKESSQDNNIQKRIKVNPQQEIGDKKEPKLLPASPETKTPDSSLASPSQPPLIPSPPHQDGMPLETPTEGKFQFLLFFF